MKQNTFHFYNFNELERIIAEINGSQVYHDATGVLIQLFNPRLDIDEDAMVEMVVHRLPKACVTGATAANLAGGSFDISQFPVELSVTCFSKTTLHQYDFDMDAYTAFVAGRMMNEDLSLMENPKLMQIFYTSTSTSINSFLLEFNHFPIAKFGLKAGRSIQKLNPAHVYGKQVYSNGFVVIVFDSKDLHYYLDNNLGWQPIGMEMVVTETESNHIIKTIDGKPATEVFEKYLNVKPNKYFVQNVCEFPLIVRRECCDMARVPAGYREDGSVIFTSDVKKGDHIKLSYADHERLAAFTAKSVQDLQDFSPEAVFLFECGNRLRFLKQNYLFEIMDYRSVAKQLSSITGYAEVFVTPEGLGGDLNSSLVAVGLSESPEATDTVITHRQPDEVLREAIDEEKEIPFVERILNFLESVSAELDSQNKELGKIAFTDQLTKVYNRWELERAIEESLLMAKNGQSYGLLFFDIDHFKHVNDTYGHDVGDMTLLAVVSLVKENLKNGHVFGRWGGEEFLYLIPDVDQPTLLEFAEKIRKQIDEACLVTVQHITISIGSTLAHPDDTLESFIKRADEAVYEAKETGRNKVIFHP
jgi:diguanylate cyclase (GGDEF)-like protein